MVIGLIMALAIYPQSAHVVSVSGADIVCETETGNLYAFEGDGFNLDDELTLIMDSNGTENIHDDSVLDAFMK